MSASRSYHQFCGVARALDIVGERWTLLLVRNLLLAPRRYGDLANGLPGITTNLLAARLKSLQKAGILRKKTLPPPASAVVYELTDEGLALEPVIMALGAWGWRLMDRPHKGDAVDLAWALLALKRRFREASRVMTIALATKDATYTVRIAPAGASVHDGALPYPIDLTLRAPPNAFRALFFQGASAHSLVAEGSLVVDGAPRDLKAFLRAFDLQR